MLFNAASRVFPSLSDSVLCKRMIDKKIKDIRYKIYDIFLFLKESLFIFKTKLENIL